MHLYLALFVLWLITDSFGTPLRKHRRSDGPTRRSQPIVELDRQAALAARAATQRKFQNAPALLAGLATSIGYAIPSSLQNAYNRASNYATNMSLLSSLLRSSQGQPSYSPYTIGVAAVASPSGTTIESLEDETDGVDDYEYYGPMTFGSQAQSLLMDFDTGSADTWVPVDCSNCGTLPSFQANDSNTFQNMSQSFSVHYGSGSVSGTLAQDTVSVGQLKVYNQTFGAVRSVSENFASSPNAGLVGMAFSTIANSGKPTLFENLISQLQAPLFSIYMTRTQAHGSEIYFGGIDGSKALEVDPRWVPVVSKTYWTVNMTAALVNDTHVSTGSLDAILDTGTSFIYLPTGVLKAIYNEIPGAKPALNYGQGFWSYPCTTPVTVSFVLGGHALALDPRDFNLGWYAGDATNRTCIAALVDAGSKFTFAILGDSFLKSFVSIYDYSHGGRVGFLKSINEQ